MTTRTTARRLATSLALALIAAACGGTSESDAIASVDAEGVRSTLASDDVSSENIAAENDSAETVPAEEPAETTTSLAAPPAVAQAIDNRFNGRQVSYAGLEFRLGTIVTTDVEPDDYLSGELDPDLGDSSMLIFVSITRDIDAASLVPRDSFQIIDASGQRTSAQDLLRPNGEDLLWFDPDLRETIEGVVLFPAMDLEGASLVIGEPGFVHEFIPFTETDTTQVDPHVIELEAGQFNPNTTFLNFNGSCTNTIDTTIVAASVQADAQGNSQYVRAAEVRRSVAVTVDFTNTGNEGCNGNSEAVYRLDPRINADGVGSAPTNGSDTTNVEVGTTVRTTFWFDISATATELAFTNLAGDVLASWIVDIPPALGE